MAMPYKKKLKAVKEETAPDINGVVLNIKGLSTPEVP